MEFTLNQILDLSVVLAEARMKSPSSVATYPYSHLYLLSQYPIERFFLYSRLIAKMRILTKYASIHGLPVLVVNYVHGAIFRK